MCMTSIFKQYPTFVFKQYEPIKKNHVTVIVNYGIRKL
jgi:hypothetical protein